VHPTYFRTLNESFFRSDPAEYLDYRLWGLVSLVGESDGERPSHEVRKFDREYTWTPDAQESRDRFAALESTVLLHHACESMLRLYLGLAFSNPCPWLAVSQLRRPGEFPTELRRLRVDLERPERIEDLLVVFTCAATAREFNARCPQEVWDSHVRALTTLLRYAIGRVLDEAIFYNAAKHGLAVLAGEQNLTLSADGRAVIGATGLALEVLDTPIVDQATKERRWREETIWVDPPAMVATAAQIIRAIRSLWATNRHRYGFGFVPDHIQLLDDDTVLSMLHRAPPGGMIFRRSWDVPYVAEDPTS